MVAIADDVFGWNDENLSSNERILVRGTFDASDGIAALNRVGRRLMCVDDTGVEHTEEAAYRREFGGDEGEMRYTPNYVSTPEPTDEGLIMNVDCKGAIEPPMRVRFLAILEEELAGLGDDVTVTDAPWD